MHDAVSDTRSMEPVEESVFGRAVRAADEVSRAERSVAHERLRNGNEQPGGGVGVSYGLIDGL
jgi:hypothetical protein